MSLRLPGRVAFPKPRVLALIPGGSRLPSRRRRDRALRSLVAAAAALCLAAMLSMLVYLVISVLPLGSAANLRAGALRPAPLPGAEVLALPSLRMLLWLDRREAVLTDARSAAILARWPLSMPQDTSARVLGDERVLLESEAHWAVIDPRQIDRDVVWQTRSGELATRADSDAVAQARQPQLIVGGAVPDPRPSRSGVLELGGGAREGRAHVAIDGRVTWWPDGEGDDAPALELSGGFTELRDAVLYAQGMGLLVLDQRAQLWNFHRWRTARGDWSVRAYPPHSVAISDAARLHVLDGGTQVLVRGSTHSELRDLVSGRSSVLESSAVPLGVWMRAGSGWIAADARGTVAVELDRAHLDVSFSTLFGSADVPGRPAHSSEWHPIAGGGHGAGRLNLLPLVWGSVKAALLAMLLALPLGLFAALYSAHTPGGRRRARVRPFVDALEAVPPVVIGLLAVMWLSPWLARHAWGAVLALVFGLAAVGAVGLWLLFRQSRAESGGAPRRLAVLVPLGLGGLGFGAILSWILPVASTPALAPLNGLLAGVALGLASVPLVYRLSDEAIHAVPGSLSAGALALGATRWQALRTVVLPVAAPALVAAAWLAFGKALGEAVIVLMASGNAALLTLSPLDGLRSIAATGVIEIPEAAHAGSHFRVLMLAMLLLFAISFVINSLADRVRQRIRRQIQSP